MIPHKPELGLHMANGKVREDLSSARYFSEEENSVVRPYFLKSSSSGCSAILASGLLLGLFATRLMFASRNK